jgi:hypothetical protein
MTDHSALWREDATEDEQIDCYQELINSGDAWRLEGHVGRTAMSLIEEGLCILGESDHRDYYGNHVPSRDQVEPGTKGSIEYARERHPERWS